MVQERYDDVFKGFRIVANSKGSRVFSKSNETLYAYDGDGLEESLLKAKEYINDRYAKRAVRRREPHIGTIDDYYEALNRLSLSKHETAMLSAHRNASEKKLTAEELALSAGWKDFSSANSHYGRLGQRIAYEVGLRINKENEQAWTEALATFDEITRLWEMHQELVDALDKLNMA